jgi:5'-methylthioadenosine phosphorylase
MRDLLGIAFIHLAAVSLDEKFRHGSRTIHRASESAITSKGCALAPKGVGNNEQFASIFYFRPFQFNLQMNEPAIGIIGGSGLYQLEGFAEVAEHKVETPFGTPSDSIVGGTMFGRRVYFLPRHGRGHRLLPHELNHRANIYALRSLNVRWIICVTAVGSLQEKYAPRDVLLPSQFFDRTSLRSSHTFFGEGIAAHVSFADPISTTLREMLAEATRATGATFHNGGTYVNMDGPAFSTRAESEFNRRNGFDVIGMTNLAEAKLAREAEIALATMAMITDYDCWKVEEEPVSVQTVIGHLIANAETAKKVLQRVIPEIPRDANWPEHIALENAIITDRKLWPAATIKKLGPIIERFL